MVYVTVVHVNERAVRDGVALLACPRGGVVCPLVDDAPVLDQPVERRASIAKVLVVEELGVAQSRLDDRALGVAKRGGERRVWYPLRFWCASRSVELT